MWLVEVNSLLASSIEMVGADSCCRIWMCPPQETQGPQTMSLPPDIGCEFLNNPALVLAASDQSPSLQAEIRVLYQKHVAFGVNTRARLIATDYMIQ